MKDKLTPNVILALGVLAVAVVALAGWFGVVSPQRSKAADLDGQISAARAQLVVAQATARQQSGGAKRQGDSLRMLARAMPRSVAMPQVLRQLQGAARRSGVRLDSVAPQASTPQTGYSTVPMQVVVTGRYLAIQHYLKQLRTQARVVGAGVHASGRLFDVASVSLAAGEAQLPQLAATIQMNVFTYSGSTGAAASTPTPESTASPSTSSSATAAGGTP